MILANHFQTLLTLFALVLTMFSRCYPQKQSQNCFSITKYRAGKGPESVKVADLNADSYPDIIVADIYSSELSVILNNGKGKFEQADGSPFYAGNVPQDISVGDFNGDGQADLALANHEVDYITVLNGNGKGGFNVMKNSPFSVQSKPHVHGIATGDFNNDGRLDLVVDSWEDDRIEVLFGDEKEGFITPGKLFEVGPIMTIPRFKVLDINQDGNLDVVISSQGGQSVNIMTGDGKGGFTSPSNSRIKVPGHVYSLAIEDTNNDGNPDLLVPHAIGQDSLTFDGLTVLIGSGDGNFNPAKKPVLTKGDFPINIGVGEISGDSWKDVFILNQKSNNLSILLGSENGFNEADYSPIPVGKQPYGMDVGDLNQDGRTDVVVSSTVDNEILILLSTCD